MFAIVSLEEVQEELHDVTPEGGEERGLLAPRVPLPEMLPKQDGASGLDTHKR